MNGQSVQEKELATQVANNKFDLFSRELVNNGAQADFYFMWICQILQKLEESKQTLITSSVPTDELEGFHELYTPLMSNLRVVAVPLPVALVQQQDLATIFKKKDGDFSEVTISAINEHVEKFLNEERGPNFMAGKDFFSMRKTYFNDLFDGSELETQGINAGDSCFKMDSKSVLIEKDSFVVYNNAREVPFTALMVVPKDQLVTSPFCHIFLVAHKATAAKDLLMHPLTFQLYLPSVYKPELGQIKLSFKVYDMAKNKTWIGANELASQKKMNVLSRGVQGLVFPHVLDDTTSTTYRLPALYLAVVKNFQLYQLMMSSAGIDDYDFMNSQYFAAFKAELYRRALLRPACARPSNVPSELQEAMLSTAAEQQKAAIAKRLLLKRQNNMPPPVEAGEKAAMLVLEDKSEVDDSDIISTSSINTGSQPATTPKRLTKAQEKAQTAQEKKQKQFEDVLSGTPKASSVRGKKTA